MDVIGIVLAGGRSRRMNGLDKAFVELGGRSLLGRVLDRLGPQCRGIVISANPDLSRFDGLGVPVVADDPPDFAGPVAGLLAGLDWIAERQPSVRSAVSCAVDTPFLPANLIARLAEAARQGGTAVACAASGGRRHVAAALWPVQARHAIRQALRQENQRRLSAVIDRLGCSLAEWPMEPVDPFLNVNRPEDLDEARRLLAWSQA